MPRHDTPFCRVSFYSIIDESGKLRPEKLKVRFERERRMGKSRKPEMIVYSRGNRFIGLEVCKVSKKKRQIMKSSLHNEPTPPRIPHFNTLPKPTCLFTNKLSASGTTKRASSRRTIVANAVRAMTALRRLAILSASEVAV